LKRHAANLIAVTALFVGCGDYEIVLPGQYLLGRTGPGSVVIAAPDKHIVVGPNVEEYGIQGEVVFGRVSARGGGDATYFIVDTKHRTHMLELSHVDWLRALKSMGIGDPHMTPPSRWDTFLKKQR
jgi:hypothetical protein